MKNTFKKISTAVLAFTLAASCTACTGSAPASSAAGSAVASTDAKTLQIGIIQYATHPSLDNCYTGFIQGLEEGGFTEGKNLKIEFQNAQGDMANSDMAAKNMVSKKYDLIAGIATPSAMSAYAASRGTNIPVVFTAVSDPVAAKIVESIEKPGGNCTGSTDVLPLESQVKMIRAFLPNAKKIGILYTTSEPNSVSQLQRIKDIGKNYGFEIVEIGVTNASEVAAAATSITAKGVDCINNFTDNNVVDNLTSVFQAASKAKIPVFGSEVEQVKIGCLASQSIDYVSLGKETGKMAAKILKGEAKASELPVFKVEDCSPVYNDEVLETLGIALPQEYKAAEAVTK